MKLHRSGWKWLLLGVALSVVLFYMFEMTSAGIERVHGPMQVVQLPETHLTENMSDSSEMRKEAAKETKVHEGKQTLEQQIAALEEEILQLKKKTLEQEKQSLQSQTEIKPHYSINEPSVNRLADSTAEILQQVSGSGLQFIAGVFHDIIN